MCGRFTLRTPSNVLLEQFLLSVEPELAPRYNIAPTQPVAVVRLDPHREGRQLAMLRWGLIPSWAKDPAMGNRMINARGETVAEKPAFRSAFKRRRCLVLADGYYEWQKRGREKQPYHIRLRDDRPFAFAGLWETWKGVADGPLTGPIESCTIITMAANELTREIHDRMPVILHPKDHDLWLDPAVQDRDRLTPLLRPFDSDRMIAEPVSSHVNNPRNDDPRCVAVQRPLF